ncbi:hypothetical protein ACJJIF_03220 [Microbulbifer sp. SSSA002]|uniref:hypothetical protein n=1 Tax=unclassified Microbulbifer TaxID=2619833 RepID=UPI00403A72B2
MLDIDFTGQYLIVRESKGKKWRRTLLPKSLLKPLKIQITHSLSVYQADLAEDDGQVYLPFARKIPAAIGYGDTILASNK